MTATGSLLRGCGGCGRIYHPEKANSYIGKIAALLYERYKAGKLPVSMVSMDNCSQNGNLLRQAVLSVARAWRMVCIMPDEPWEST